MTGFAIDRDRVKEKICFSQSTQPPACRAYAPEGGRERRDFLLLPLRGTAGANPLQNAQAICEKVLIL
jgi:hypothetical protein